MRTVVPEYYLKFSCIGGSCRHNCCREGWEIGLDDAHAKKYKEISSNAEFPLSDRVKEGVFMPTVRQRQAGERPHILMGKDGVCPFLNADGLCDLILSYGESILCQICEDHPRFRNFYNDHVEMGIGLCCEEAVRLILTAGNSVSYIDLHSKEAVIPEHRKQAASIQKTVEDEKELDFFSVAEYLLCLDSLETEWKTILAELQSGKEAKSFVNPGPGVMAAIEEYLRFRHLKKDGEAFVTFSLWLIRTLYETGSVLADKDGESRMAEILRIYSSEIEYSEEAMELITKKLNR